MLVDGVDVRDLEPEHLWSRVGIVPQRPYLFSGTVASNLRYGNPDATDEQLWTALEVAQAAEFVRAMPAGLDAPIAQGGTNVSGGQRQRLAIARLLVRAPQIYLFDDSFSALDLATDARLRAALRPVTATATVLVVAQRVASIRDADQIVVLDDGAVVGIGTHDELLVTSPTYAEIVASQFSAEEIGPEADQRRKDRRGGSGMTRPSPTPTPVHRRARAATTPAARHGRCPRRAGVARRGRLRGCRPRSRWTSARRRAG